MVDIIFTMIIIREIMIINIILTSIRALATIMFIITDKCLDKRLKKETIRLCLLFNSAFRKQSFS